MNKAAIRDNLHISNNKLWNNNKTILGFNIAYCAWHDEPWKVLHNDKCFDDVTDQTKYIRHGFTCLKLTYKPIATFKKQVDIIKYIYNIKNKKK